MTTEDDKLSALFDKLVGGKKKNGVKKKEADPLKEAVRKAIVEVKREHDKKVPKQFQNGSGYDYTKVWDEEGKDFRYISTARVKMAEYLGRPLEEDERVYFFNRKLKGEAKYAASNLLLGDQSGPFYSELVCKCCGTKGDLQGSFIPKTKQPESHEQYTALSMDIDL